MLPQNLIISSLFPVEQRRGGQVFKKSSRKRIDLIKEQKKKERKRERKKGKKKEYSSSTLLQLIYYHRFHLQVYLLCYPFSSYIPLLYNLVTIRKGKRTRCSWLLIRSLLHDTPQLLTYLDK